MEPRPRTAFERLAGVPTGLLVALSVLPLAASLGVLAEPAFVVPVVALDLAITVVAALDLALTQSRVEVRREVDAVQAVGREFEVRLSLHNLTGRRLQAVVGDDAPGRARGLPALITLEPRRSFDVPYLVAVDRRGRHDFGDVVLRVRSPLRLWQTQRRFTGDDHVRVYPDFAQLRETGFRGRLSEERVPVHSRRRPGGENEFQRLRPYVSGDPFRHIDWKASARGRDLVTREFGQESNQNLIFLLDCGRMMSSRSGGLTAFDRALNAAILLGQVAARHGDRVGLLAFDDQPRVWLPPKAGSRDGSRLIRATYDIEPSLREPDYAAAFRQLARRVRRRSLVVLFTQVIDEVNAELATQLVQTLAGRHLPITVWLRDEDIEQTIARPGEGVTAPWVRAAAAHLVGWRERALENLSRRGAFVLDVRQEELTPRLLHRYLEVKARRLL
ncbi:MAG: DUF58 domain-containing protein [Myxococcota bacterium]